MNRQGTVSKIEGKMVTVVTQPLECCSGDSNCLCMQSGKLVMFQALNANGHALKPGDQVDVGAPLAQTTRGLIRLLMLPVVFAVLGYLVIQIFAKDGQPFSPLVGATIGFGLGLAADLLLRKPKERDYPTIEAVVPKV